ncbi:sigma-70 family RNA polymerase sigma factor [Oscillospiraceae bacterium OttesenSCG-928-G22]|nr:sigma-70 family RNA polymerase sigma factor [Oscillospiraceae bacterium OttesenSCG-928-G22]
MSNYYIKIKSEMIPVSVEVYQCVTRSRRQLRYITHDLKSEQIIIDKGNVTILPSREYSYDLLLERDVDIKDEGVSVEELAIQAIMISDLRDSINRLTAEERELIQKVFFDNQSEREIAKSLGITQPAVHKRVAAIIDKLKRLLKNWLSDALPNGNKI